MTVIFSLMICSCTDDFNYYNGDIPEGEGDLRATVTFTPAVATNLHATRTPGDTIKDINSLCVLVYTPDGDLVRKYTKTKDKDELEGYISGKYDVQPNDYFHDDKADEPHADEETTTQATFSLPGLPYGRYKIYAVANMGNLADYDIQTEEKLRNIKLEWNENDITANNQMFGCFTREDAKSAEDFNAPELTFTPTNSRFHAWLNRVVSKVTIAFDASGLNQDVTIYIRNVTIRDIPKYCVLGNTNKPEEDSENSELLNQWRTSLAPDYNTSSPAIPNSRFEYNSEGIITNGGHTGSANTDGYKLENSLREPVPANAHATNAASLFFFENMQGDFQDETDKVKYNKQQQPSGEPDGVGTSIRDDKDNKDFKDRVPYGTYIEVEAYYISANPGKIGEGSIKYRFMLGKNVTYNYNAQRNYHFKLTLGFNGWANQPDWHIDYEQPEPGIEVPPVFRVSYLYHQKSELPIRILGECTNLTVTITENNWAPYDSAASNAPYFVPPSEPITTLTPNPVYAFKWNREAYLNPEYMKKHRYSDGTERDSVDCAFGFLALYLPNRNTTTVSQSFSATANNELRNNYSKVYNINSEKYSKVSEGKRWFTGKDLEVGSHGPTDDDNSYEVKVVYDNNKELLNQKTLMLPVWTRAKTLIAESGFSGNNPYEGYERKAVLHIEATFADGTVKKKDVTVLQVKRLVNPKGVWRAADRNGAFQVTLLEAENGNGMANFQPFTSQGEWTAYIEGQTNKNAGFYITPNGETNGYQQGDTIHGYTGSEIHFDINFDKVTVSDTDKEPKCAIVKVLYHGNQCLHKILVRKGYDQPVTMGGNTWSSFSLYRATLKSANDTSYDAVLTKNPLMLGSMFRRGNLTQGILVVNNIADEGGVGPFEAPGEYKFLVGEKSGDDWIKLEWNKIDYRPDKGTSRSLGTFYDGVYTYKVPSLADFKALTLSTHEVDFGFGVVYGSSATAPARKAVDAYGLIDPYNEGLFDDPRGMRGVIAYKKDTGNQIFFPMGKYGTGRRNNFTMKGMNAGVLRYGDVDYLLTNSIGNNLYRPIPYNLMVQSGNIYWIDKWEATGGAEGKACLGWDMNYFNFDFNPYTENNYQDACPIKFIITKTQTP
ncbi:MAG: hypothetical protein K2H47_08870 [Muribaculaceae bacterium]|nr:hypothetical protein [Muribaculaceae bacterium]